MHRFKLIALAGAALLGCERSAPSGEQSRASAALPAPPSSRESRPPGDLVPPGPLADSIILAALDEANRQLLRADDQAPIAVTCIAIGTIVRRDPSATLLAALRHGGMRAVATSACGGAAGSIPDSVGPPHPLILASGPVGIAGDTAYVSVLMQRGFFLQGWNCVVGRTSGGWRLRSCPPRGSERG
jgi:hypothetical protein